MGIKDPRYTFWGKSKNLSIVLFFCFFYISFLDYRFFLWNNNRNIYHINKPCQQHRQINMIWVMINGIFMKKCMHVIYRLVMKKIYDKCTSLSAIHFNSIILKLKQNKTEKKTLKTRSFLWYSTIHLRIVLCCLFQLDDKLILTHASA